MFCVCAQLQKKGIACRDRITGRDISEFFLALLLQLFKELLERYNRCSINLGPNSTAQVDSDPNARNAVQRR